MPHPLPATGSVAVGVAASPDALWRHVADPGSPARFSLELKEAAFEEAGAAAAVGAVIVGRNENGASTWTSHSTVVACDPPRRFAWATGGAEAPVATWTLEIEPADGGSTLTHTVVLHPGLPPLQPAIDADPEGAQTIVGDRMATLLANMARVAAGIAAAAEADPG